MTSRSDFIDRVAARSMAELERLRKEVADNPPTLSHQLRAEKILKDLQRAPLLNRKQRRAIK